MALTVVSILTVTGFVVGCDSDDTPTVTPPAQGGGGSDNGSSPTPTRNTEAETGRDNVAVADGGRLIRNSGNSNRNIRFNYDAPKHYRLNAGFVMSSDPENTGSAPTWVACDVPATARANGQCWNNDGVATPEPHSSVYELTGSTVGACMNRIDLPVLDGGTRSVIYNRCNYPINIGFGCGTGSDFSQFTSYVRVEPDDSTEPSRITCSGGYTYQACRVPRIPEERAGGSSTCIDGGDPFGASR